MKLTKILFVLLIAAGFTFAQNENGKKLQLKTFEDSVSYSLGQNLGKNLNDPNMKINFECVTKGIEDYFKSTSLLKEDDMRRVLMTFNQQMMEVKNKEAAVEKEKNKKEGEAFLEANKKKDGVKELTGGLQYKVLKSGNGPSPVDTSVVKVNYKGTLIDGTEFDSSYKRGKPAEFPVNRVIKGWTEALTHMHVGDKWELYIPPELAYGENGAGQIIKPNSTLVFEVELLDIVK